MAQSWSVESQHLISINIHGWGEPVVCVAVDVVAEDTTVGGNLADGQSESSESGGDHGVQVLKRMSSRAQYTNMISEEAFIRSEDVIPDAECNAGCY